MERICPMKRTPCNIPKKVLGATKVSGKAACLSNLKFKFSLSEQELAALQLAPQQWLVEP